VAVTSTGSVLVGAACGRGHVGLFSSATGGWRLDSATLPGAWHNASTTVLRLQAGGAQATVLVLAAHRGRRSLFALTGDDSGTWRVSSPFPLAAGSTVRASAVDPAGAVSVLVGSKKSPSVAEINPDGSWATIPAPPVGTLGLAWVAPSSISLGGTTLDAFTVVNGTELHVFALTPAGTKWVPAQTLQVPLAYGSSS
jgi:hypothetical protein